MAEAAVAIVINKATDAKPLLQGHYLQEHISWMKTEMKDLQSYLKDAESKKATWFINSIRDLALDMEDFLDTHLPQFESQKSNGLLGSCSTFCDVANSGISLKIEEFKKKAAKIEKSKVGFSVEPSYGGEKQIGHRLDKNFIGRQKIVQQIKAEMFTENDKCRLISIVGAGGIGKTTVAKQIYIGVKSNFDCSAMVCVSEESTFLEILFDIANQVGLPQNEKKRNMHENLYSFLRERRYLLFLDDVLNQLEALKDIIMTDNRNGSRIIVTCRKPNSCKSDKEFQLDILGDREGKELFYDTMKKNVSWELKRIGDKIVHLCHGLPLAIQVIAGFLKGKDISVWNDVLQRISQCSEEEEEEDRLRVIWELSYQDLPTKLKPFFLYFGVFPINREVFVSEMTSYWVIDKLYIQGSDSYGEPDEIVEELIARNVIQVIRRKSDGMIKSCGIPNLLHELCIQKAEEINFFCTWDNLKKVDSPSASTARRVITTSFTDQSNNQQSPAAPSKLRSLICFDRGNEIALFIKNHASELKFLQLLTIEIENKTIYLPHAIADLSGLIYLKLKGQYIVLPSSVQRMKKLRTLEVRAREIPESVFKMKYLKHLFMTAVRIKMRGGGGGGSKVEVDLQNLEVLESDFQYSFELNSSVFKKMPNLTKLTALGIKKPTLQALSVSSGAKPLLQNLKNLRLRADLISIAGMNVDLSAYENLQTLHIESSINIASSFGFPKNLARLTLDGIDAQDKDPLEMARRLPGLETIKLDKCNIKKINFSGHGNFPQLKLLVLLDTKFHHLAVDDKGTPKLEKFIYKPHPKQPSHAEIPEKLSKVMEEINNHGLKADMKTELGNLLSLSASNVMKNSRLQKLQFSGIMKNDYLQIIKNSYLQKLQFKENPVKSCWKWITMA